MTRTELFSAFKQNARIGRANGASFFEVCDANKTIAIEIGLSEASAKRAVAEWANKQI